MFEIKNVEIKVAHDPQGIACYRNVDGREVPVTNLEYVQQKAEVLPTPLMIVTYADQIDDKPKHVEVFVSIVGGSIAYDAREDPYTPSMYEIITALSDAQIDEVFREENARYATCKHVPAMQALLFSKII